MAKNKSKAEKKDAPGTVDSTEISSNEIIKCPFTDILIVINDLLIDLKDQKESNTHREISLSLSEAIESIKHAHSRIAFIVKVLEIND